MNRNECLNSPHSGSIQKKNATLWKLVCYSTTSNQIIVKINMYFVEYICASTRCVGTRIQQRGSEQSASKHTYTTRECNIQQSCYWPQGKHCTLDVDAYQDLHKNIKNILYETTAYVRRSTLYLLSFLCASQFTIVSHSASRPIWSSVEIM